MRAQMTTLMAVLAAGCAATRPPSPAWDARANEGLLERAREWLVGPEPPPVVTAWSPLLPVGGVRGDLLPASFPAERLASLLPSASSEVQQAGFNGGSGSAELVAIDGKRIASYRDFYARSNRLDAKSTPRCVVRLGGGRERQVVVPAADVRALEDALLPDGKPVKIADEGVERLVCRRDGAIVRASMRVNAPKRLGQLILSLQRVAGEDQALPHDVVVSQRGKLCRFLNASDVLERLYGEAKSTPGAKDASFAAISEADDYFALANYPRLEARHLARKATRQEVPEPMLAGLVGVRYPGPPILADARALTGFLLQREKLGPHDGERTAWLFFDLAEPTPGGTMRVSIDLGNTSVEFEFKQLND